ncbi:hypothetical protein CCHR01_18818 [Colletotrichum chrysophilum]|uniref:Uncharacterized protein n=1 Tax=Colletotrichum chrysophilum TaxID=1836956 RepID=A0AAD9A0W9_9PEZI|nr:hypothetical protein CCHR01_18818 [Colletotrichum chrysophilum]
MGEAPANLDVSKIASILTTMYGLTCILYPLLHLSHSFLLSAAESPGYGLIRALR